MAISSSKTADDEVTIVLDDTFDFNCVDEFRSAYETKPENGKNNFVIDFRKTCYMDSSALGMLINMERFWKDHNSNIRIVNVNPQLRKILMISRFDKKFTIE